MSFANAFTDEDVQDFDDRFIRRYLGLEDGSTAGRYTAEPKIDGLVLSLRYENGTAGAGRDTWRRLGR